MLSSEQQWWRTRQRVRQRVRTVVDRRRDEDKLQSTLVGFLNAVLRDRLVFAIPNGSRRLPGGRAANAVPGLMPGFPDLGVALLHGRVLWLEAKTDDGRLSEQQLRVHKLLRDLGHAVEVVRSVEDTRAALHRHKVPTREALNAVYS